MGFKTSYLDNIQPFIFSSHVQKKLRLPVPDLFKKKIITEKLNLSPKQECTAQPVPYSQSRACSQAPALG